MSMETATCSPTSDLGLLGSSDNQTHTPISGTARKGTLDAGYAERNAKSLGEYVGNPTWEARNAIVETNLPLVISCAQRFAGRSAQMDDLIAEGNVGLIRAVERFDPARGVKFSTFALKHIEGAMRSSLGKTGSAVTMPGRIRSAARRWIREQRDLQSSTGFIPSAAEVAQSLGMKGDEAQRACDAAKVLDATSTDAFEAQLPAKVSSYDLETREGSLDLNDSDRLEEALLNLEPRAAALIRKCYGLDGETPLALAKAARQVGVTHEAAVRILNRAMAELRTLLSARGAGQTMPTPRPRLVAAAA